MPALAVDQGRAFVHDEMPALAVEATFFSRG
jgi:hypothetical protein